MLIKTEHHEFMLDVTLLAEKKAVIPCIKKFHRYHAIGKRYSLEFSWHVGKRCVELLVEEKDGHGGWISWHPDASVRRIVSIENKRVYFTGNHPGDLNAWNEAVKYVYEAFGFVPLLKGVNHEV